MTENTAVWHTIPARELKNQAVEVPDDLIEGLLPTEAVVTFAGSPGLGKSFVALSWAASVASGTNWFSQKVGEPKRVIYVLGEGWTRFGDRVTAWEDVHGLELPDTLEFVDAAKAGIDLLDEGHVNAAIAAFSRDGANPPALIVLDTFSMLATVNSENDNAEVARVFASLHRIARGTGATVVIIHHVSKQNGQVRGATAFRGNADTVIMARESGRDNDQTFNISTAIEYDGKQRDTEPITLYGFSISDPGVLTKTSDEVTTSDEQADQMTALLNNPNIAAAIKPPTDS